jgi:hypothetical protein
LTAAGVAGKRPATASAHPTAVSAGGGRRSATDGGIRIRRQLCFERLPDVGLISQRLDRRQPDGRDPLRVEGHRDQRVQRVPRDMRLLRLLQARAARRSPSTAPTPRRPRAKLALSGSNAGVVGRFEDTEHPGADARAVAAGKSVRRCSRRAPNDGEPRECGFPRDVVRRPQRL